MAEKPLPPEDLDHQLPFRAKKGLLRRHSPPNILFRVDNRYLDQFRLHNSS
jgi:hypothetical protein